MVQQQADGEGQLAPGGLVGLQLFHAGAGQRVVFGAPVIFGDAPFRLDPAFALAAVQGGIQRALSDPEGFFGNLLDALGYGPAVERLERQRFENEQIECALRQVHIAPLSLLQGKA